jgi:hypothetical protein
MKRRLTAAATVLWAASAALAQTPARPAADPESKPFQSQSTSSITYTGGKEGERIVETTSVTFDVTGDSIPDRPRSSHLVVRTTTRSKWYVGDEGSDSTVTVETWPLGVDLKQKPLYAVSVSGIGAHIIDGNVLLVDRGDGGDVSWWSLYKLGSGQHLFDTYAELLKFPVSREDGNSRFAGLEVPPDNARDARLKDPHVIGVLSVASAEKLIREVLITCTDPKRATLLRGYEDVTRKLSVTEQPTGRTIRVEFEENFPSKPSSVVVSIPIVKDDLDPVHAQLPPGIKAVVWRR